MYLLDTELCYQFHLNQEDNNNLQDMNLVLSFLLNLTLFLSVKGINLQMQLRDYMFLMDSLFLLLLPLDNIFQPIMLLLLFHQFHKTLQILLIIYNLHLIYEYYLNSQSLKRLLLGMVNKIQPDNWYNRLQLTFL